MPIVRESQVGSHRKIFWFVLGFMIVAFANPMRAEAATEGAFSNKGVRFSVKRFSGRSPSTFGLV
jgi:hypothetical protein